MTVSPEKRSRDRESLLTQMLEALPPPALYSDCYFGASDFPEILETTWLAAAEDGLITWLKQTGPRKYALTGDGWLRAMKVSGRFDSAETLQRCGALMAFLGDMVRDGQTLYEWEWSGPEPRSWNANAIHSGLLAERFPTRRITFQRAHRNAFRISRTFGQLGGD
jgi:hypothetical protein